MEMRAARHSIADAQMLRWASILFGSALLLLPFFINPLQFSGVRSTKTLQLGNLTAIVSHIGTPSEYVWIWPRVLLVFFVGLVGLLLLPAGTRLPRKAFPLLLLGYIALVYASTLFNVNDDWNFRLLGGVGRLDGPFYQTGLVLFGIFAYALVFLTRDLRKLLASILPLVAIASAVETLVLVVQRMGFDFVGLILRGGAYPAPVGTIGHPGMAAGLLLTGLFSAFWTAESTRNRRVKLLIYLLATFIGIGIGVTTNKSSTIAIFLSLLAFWVIRRDRRSVLPLALFATGVFVLTPLIPNRLGFDRSLADTKTGQTRLYIWKMAVEAILKTPGQPLIGAGPDGFLLTLANKIPIQELLQEYRLEYGWPRASKIADIKPLYKPNDPVRSRAFMVTLENYPEAGQKHRFIYRYYLDKAHNFFLDRAVSYGLLSAALWLALFLLPPFRLFKNKDITSAYLLTGTLALFVYYLAWFPVPQTEAVHLTWLALAWGWAENSQKNYE